MNKEFKEIDINSVDIKSTTRQDVGDLSTLEGSIKKLGLLHPIIVGNNNVLICGERRLQACKNVGLSTIAVLKIPIDYDSMTAVEIQSDANLCREQLSNDELDKLIQTKKSLISSPSTDKPSGFFAKLKSIFARK